MFQGADTFGLLAELSVAVLGFSGIVAVLGRRAEGDWSELDRRRFHRMVLTAAITVLLSLLPFLLHAAGLGGSALWAWSSGVGAVFCLALLVPWLREWASAKPWSDAAVSKAALAYVLVAWVGAPVLLGLNAVGIGFSRSFAPYLFACLLLFGVSVVLFLRLLGSEVGRRRSAA